MTKRFPFVGAALRRCRLGVAVIIGGTKGLFAFDQGIKNDAYGVYLLMGKKGVLAVPRDCFYHNGKRLRLYDTLCERIAANR